ncbi:DUF1482 family protein [Enterobacter ludwigii]|jgi:hypothetical protein|uniref:DUF1482 family protein n=1 Tax=Enterobacter ludwigii TaxID=299767 RepID=UPI00103A9FDC|nr:DUF1482 family protein [Enterobacter ludwigii]
MTPLFALVLTICSGSTDCTDLIEGVYETKAECSHIIYEERYLNAGYYPVDGILHSGAVTASDN